jgi:N-acetylmuramoyl-L-alanine amidase
MKTLVLIGLFVIPAQAASPVIAIDAGHGGRDKGAVIRGRSEAKIVLEVAEAMAEILAEDPAATPFLTRADDSFVALSERVLRAERAKAKVLMSLHVDNVRGRRGRGVIVYIYGANKKIPKGPPREPGEPRLPAPPKAQVVRSRVLAGHIGAQLRKAGIKAVRYVDIGGFAVLKGRGIPSVLVELGNMRDEKEASALSKPDFQKKMAQALVTALKIHLDVNTVEAPRKK